jgi:hypothetical protein
MEWHPWYRFVIIALIILIVRYFQQSSAKKFSIKNNKIEGDKSYNLNNGDMVFFINIPINQSIINLIDEMEYILISKNVSSDNYYEITFMNYKKKLFDFKRQSTYIKLNGNDNSQNITYTTWSDRYEFGQNSHNDKIANEFLLKLLAKISLHK